MYANVSMAEYEERVDVKYCHLYSNHQTFYVCSIRGLKGTDMEKKILTTEGHNKYKKSAEVAHMDIIKYAS